MRHLLLVLLLLLPCRAFAAETGNPAPAFRITGVAVSARDGAPIPFCRLRIFPVGAEGSTVGGRQSRFDGVRINGGFDQFRSRRSDGPAAENDILADAHGRFSIETPGAGTWWLAGVARGFHLQAYEAHETFSSTIVLTETAPSVGLTFRLAPDAGISGVVFDEAGEPVAGAQVQAEDVATPEAQPIRTAPTDDRGHYEFAGLAPGSYRVRVDARPWYANGGGGPRSTRTNISVPAESSLDPSLDLVYSSTWYPGSDTPDAAEVLRLSGGEERQADFHLLPLPAAHLSVARTAPPAGAADSRGWGGPLLVRVADSRSDRPEAFGGPTGAMRSTATTWEIGGIAPGTYEMKMPDSDEVRQVTVKAGGVVDFASASPLIRVGLHFDGDAGDRPQVTLTALAGGERYVLGGARPELSNLGGRRRGDDGPRRSDGSEDSGPSMLVPAGRYRVAVASGADSYLETVLAEGAQVTDEVVQIEHPAVLTLKMLAGRAQLRGVARRGDAPAPAAMVVLVPASGDPASLADRITRAETSSDGSFVLEAVVPGPYILVVLDGGWAVNWRDARTLAGYLVHGTPLNLKPASSQSVDVAALRP